MSRTIDDVFERYYPGPVALAILICGLAVLLTARHLPLVKQVEFIATGFHELLTLQLALIFWWYLSVTAVESPRVGAIGDRLVELLAPVTTSQTNVVAVTTFLAVLLGWMNWALGLIVGLFIGRALYAEARENGVDVHYPAVIAGALASLLVSNQGLSSPGGLVLADDGLVNVLAESVGTITFETFLLHPANLVASAILVTTIPLLITWLAPEPDDEPEIDDSTMRERFIAYKPPTSDWTTAEKLENAKSLSYLTGGGILLSTAIFFVRGGPVSLTWVLFVLIAVTILSHEYPQAFVEKTTKSIQWTLPVAIPFLFYAATFVMVEESGVVESFVAPHQYAIVTTYIGAFLTGLLIPDPGTVWLLLAPVGAEAGLGPTVVAIASMFGAGISNYWLGIFLLSLVSPTLEGIPLREFLRYAVAVTIYSSVLVCAILLIL